MAAIITLLVTITISILVTRVGAVALALTGLSHEIANFQARSAFTGVGFTTDEAETIVNHPVRRKILMLLMFWGNIGIAAVIASTIASLGASTPDDAKWWELTVIWLTRLSVLICGIGILFAIFTSRFVDRYISRWVERALRKFTRLDVQDYTSLLHLHNGYVVMELQVNSDDWVANKDLNECSLSSEGVLILGLTRKSGAYVGSPNGVTMIETGDMLTVYGPSDRLEELDIRKQGYQGDRAHRIAMEVQKQVAEDPELSTTAE